MSKQSTFTNYFKQEFKLQIKRNYIWIILLVSVFPGILLAIMQTDQSKLSATYTQILLYLFPILAAMYFSEDFSHKTSRIIYFNQMRKQTIFCSKIVCYLLIGTIFSVVRLVLFCSDQIFEGEIINLVKLGEVFLAELLFISLVGGVASLIATITYQKMASIVTVLLIFLLEPNIRALLYIVTENSQSWLRMLLDNFPISTISEAITYHTLNVHKFLLLFFVSIFLYGCSALVLEKKESV
jgi:hypothetical protein